MRVWSTGRRSRVVREQKQKSNIKKQNSKCWVTDNKITREILPLKRDLIWVELGTSKKWPAFVLIGFDGQELKKKVD